jgi:hypothetical protein
MPPISHGAQGLRCCRLSEKCHLYTRGTKPLAHPNAGMTLNSPKYVDRSSWRPPVNLCEKFVTLSRDGADLALTINIEKDRYLPRGIRIRSGIR